MATDNNREHRSFEMGSIDISNAELAALRRRKGVETPRAKALLFQKHMPTSIIRR